MTKLTRFTHELRRQHKLLDLQFERVVDAAQSGDWRNCDELWSDFERTLIDHIRFEEIELFPEYARVDALAAHDAKVLKAEHDEMIKAVESLGDDLQLHHTLNGVVEFIEALRRHAAREDVMFHPWYESVQRTAQTG